MATEEKPKRSSPDLIYGLTTILLIVVILMFISPLFVSEPGMHAKAAKGVFFLFRFFYFLVIILVGLFIIYLFQLRGRKEDLQEQALLLEDLKKICKGQVKKQAHAMGDIMDMKNRRKFPRLDVSVKIGWEKKLKVPVSEPGNVSVTRNLSGGGVCFIAHDKVESGDILALKFELPNKKIIKAEGKVAWVNEFEIIGGRYEKGFDVGLEFLNITDENRRQIVQFVSASSIKEDTGL